jgi:hypothetical protein
MIPMNTVAARLSRRLRMAVGALLLSAATGASAHHGWSEYDAGRVLTVTGAIVDAGYDNPHGFVRIKTGDRIVRVILAPPSRMEARGLARDALKPGVNVTVVGYPHRKDPQEMRAERVSLPGGQPVELR